MPNIKYRPLSMEEEISKELETPTPYIFKLEKGNKKLICFGIKHMRNYSDSQFERFDENLNDLKEGIVLIEAEDKTIKEDKTFSSEIDYFIFKSKEKDFEISGIDLNLLGEILKFSDKYEPKETILLLALAFLNKPGERTKIKEKISRVIQIISKEKDFLVIYDKSRLDEISLINLLEDYTKKILGKNLSEITEEDNLFPSPLKNKCVLNRFVREISYDRDAFMLKNLEETLKKYDNVLYVLGKNHIIRQEETIREIFNSTKHRKEFL